MPCCRSGHLGKFLSSRAQDSCRIRFTGAPHFGTLTERAVLRGRACPPPLLSLKFWTLFTGRPFHDVRRNLVVSRKRVLVYLAVSMAFYAFAACEPCLT